mmetsp:Transcript_46198/g.145372  ORF Transcript_46198/g.145372 Transcript_46198/m.145372 type:complete len:82 (+) Transcript_46198:205-450(+)
MVLATPPRHVRDSSAIHPLSGELFRRSCATPKPWSGTLPYHLCAACMLAAASIPLLLRRSEREAEEAAQGQLREGTAAAAG